MTKQRHVAVLVPQTSGVLLHSPCAHLDSHNTSKATQGTLNLKNTRVEVHGNSELKNTSTQARKDLIGPTAVGKLTTKLKLSPLHNQSYSS